MKVLWVCNLVLPLFSEIFKLPNTNLGGWLSSSYEELIRNGIDIAVCSPVEYKTFKKMRYTKYFNENLKCFLFPEFLSHPERKSKTTKNFLKEIISEYQPDIVHIHGTEYYHTLALTELLNPNQYVISIQGLVSYIEKSYFLGLPYKIYYKKTIRDILKNDSLYKQKMSLHKRGEFEIQALKNSKNVIGRTEWDYSCVKLINNNIRYFTGNECIRREFYFHKWDENKCIKHSIFVSQCSSPIKGFHILLESISIVKQFYDDVKIYTTGPNLLKMKLYEKQKLPYYQKYLIDIINKNDLQNNIEFLGYLNEKQMVDAMLKSQVFICCSSIENSSNAIGEAIQLSMPIIVSDVGGNKDIVNSEKVAMIYPANEYYTLAARIINIFSSNKIDIHYKELNIISNKRYDRKENIHNLIKIYEKIYREKNDE